LLQCSDSYAADGEDRIGRECNNFGGIAMNAVNVRADLTNFDLEVSTELPSQLLECLFEDCKPGLRFRIIQTEDVDDTDEA